MAPDIAKGGARVSARDLALDLYWPESDSEELKVL